MLYRSEWATVGTVRFCPSAQMQRLETKLHNISVAWRRLQRSKLTHNTPRHGAKSTPLIHVQRGYWISSLWNRCRRELAIQGELLGQQCHATGVDDGKRLELREFFILDQLVPTIVEDQPALVIPDGENGMIDADGIVMDERHAHVFGTHPGLPKGHVFGEGVILAVAVTGFESTFFVDEGRSPLIRNAPLASCRVHNRSGR